jgi:integrase
VNPTRETLAEFADRWLEDRKRELRPGPGSDTTPCCAGMFCPSWARPRYRTRAVLRAMLQDALRLGVVVTNVVERTKAPKQAPQQVTAFTLDEIDALLSAAEGTRTAPLLRLLAFSGLRRGEAVGLRWGDVDMQAGTTVRRSRVSSKEGTIENRPKTEAGVRRETMPEAVMDALRAQWAQQAQDKLRLGPAYKDAGYVFATADGAPILPKNVTRDFYRIRAKANKNACADAPPGPRNCFRENHRGAAQQPLGPV